MTNAPPHSMPAIRLHAPGGIGQLRLDEVPVPTPVDGEVLVQVHAAGITRDELDWPTDRLPAVPSYELSGIVNAVGNAVSGFEVGDAVYGLTGFDRDGVAAEYAAVPADRLAAKPESLTHVEAAALTLAGLSALQGLFDHGQLHKNQRVLIHGATGGVGHYAVQLAHLHGAYVIATAASPRLDTARSLGADQVLESTAELSGLEPVDLVFDTAGGDRLTRSVDVVAAGGRLVSVAEEPPTSRCADRGVEGIYFVVEPNRNQLEELARLANQGALRPVIERTYPLVDAAEAFTYSQSHHGSGKIVLTLNGTPT